MDEASGVDRNIRPNETTTVSFRATAEEVAAIDAAANADARQRAPWIRQAVVEAAQMSLQKTTTGVSSAEAQSGIKNERRIPSPLWLLAAFTGAAVGAFIGATVATTCIQNFV